MSIVSTTFPGTQGAARALVWAAIIKLAEGNGEEAEVLADRALVEAAAFDDSRLEADLLTVRIMTKAFVGSLQQALEACEEGIKLAEEHHFFRFRNMCMANMSAVAIDMGLDALAEQNLLEVVRAAETNEVVADIAHGYFNLAVLRLTQGRLPEVRDLAERCLDLATRSGNHFITLSCHALLGICAVERGAFHEARFRKQAIVEETREFIGDDIVPIEHFLARMAEIEGKVDTGIARLERTVANPPPFANACCQLELKLELARLLSKRDVLKAQTLAQEVHDKAKAFGARAIEHAADSLQFRLQNVRAGGRRADTLRRT
jgi:hypothetical protein